MIGHDDFLLAALLESGLLTADGADQSRRHATQHAVSVGEAVVALRLLDPSTVALLRAQTAECAYVDLNAYNIQYSNTTLLPRSAAESLRAFPLFALEDVVTIGMADPLDLRAVDQLRSHFDRDIDPVLCEPGALLALIERAYTLAGNSSLASTSREIADDSALNKEPVVAAVNQIIAQGLDLGASDIHIGPDEHDLHLRYRVDGALQEVQGPGIELHEGLVQRLKVMANLDLTQARRPQDGKFRFTHSGREIDIRLSLIPTVVGENAVLRLLNSANAIRGFDELGFPQDRVKELETIIEQPHGMVLVTGPTGSGKTTTLYTALKRLNTPDVNIMTIEDPVEIRMPLIRQVQVNSEIGLTFASALRSILRQDPDVVFVGEIRDEETARISVQAALTGHLVLSSLHTNDAAGAIPRLRDLACPAFAINAALLCVIAQRLTRRVCADCAKPVTPDAMLCERFGIDPESPGFRRGVGCARCGGQGLRGRLGVYEMLTMTPEVRHAIDRGATSMEILETAVAAGMKTMLHDGLEKARLGQTTLEEVARVVSTLEQAWDSKSASARRAA